MTTQQSKDGSMTDQKAREIERDAFERWYCRGDDVMTFVPWHDILDQPDDFVENMAWEAWLAAKESLRSDLAAKDAEIERSHSDCITLTEKLIDRDARIQQQAAEIERLTNTQADMIASSMVAITQIEQLQARVNNLVRFTRHDAQCRLTRWGVDEGEGELAVCDCGLSKLINHPGG